MKKDNKSEDAILRQKAEEIIKSTDGVSEFAENIINTIRESLLILDQDLRVVKASRSFYNFFKVTAGETIGKLIYDLGNNQWDIPKLRELLETILPEKTTFDDFEVEHNFSTIGKRVMLLNARQIQRAFGKEKIILLAIEDITERKLSEESLSEESRMTSEYLDKLLDHTHAPIIIWDSSLVIKRFNHQFEKLSGYNSTEVIDRKIDILFPKDKIDSTFELLNNHLSDEDSEVIEVDILTKYNDIKTVIWNSANIFDKEGTSTIATIAQDITIRKRKEEALGILETRYRRLFESAKDGILILNAETGKIIDVNPFLMELLGYSKEEMVGQEIWEIGFFKDIAANKEKFAELQQIEYVQYDNLPLETVSGRKINVEFVSNVYLVGKNKVIQCNIRDITKRKQAELALQNSETHLRTLVQTIPDLIWLKDPDGKYLSCNTRFESLYGAREADIIGKTDYDFVERDLADFFRENDRKAIAAGKPTSNEEWLTFAEDSHREFMDTIKTPMFDFNGKLIGVLGIGRDNTQRNLAEQKVRASEKRFRAIFDQAPIAIALLDLQGHPIISNSPLSKMLGYSSDELSKMKFTEFTYPEDIDKDLNQFTDLIAGKISGYSMEKRYIHKNGNLIWANLFVTTLNDNNDLPLKIIGIVDDITERKKAEDALLESEIKYRAFFENSMDAILLTSTEGKIQSANQAACTMFGYSEDELIGLGRSGVVDVTDPRLKVLLAERKLKGKTQGEITLIRKDGTHFPAEISTAVFKNYEGHERTSMIIRDITVRIDSEKALRQSEEKFRSYIDNAPDGVLVVDESGRYIDVNNAACIMSGYSENELLKMSISDLLTEESLEDGLAHFNALIQNGKSKSDLSFKHKDGCIRWAAFDSVKLTESRFLGFSKDITERKQAEDALRESESQLAETQLVAKVGSWTTDLTTLKVGWSKETYRIFEIDADSFQASHQAFLEFVHPEDREKVNTAFALSFNNSSVNTIEHRVLTLNGKIKFVEEYWQIIRDDQGNPIRAVGSCQDITEHKQAEKEIAMLAHSLKSINECVSITDLDDKILFVNESFLKTYGYNLNELIGENISMVRSLSYDAVHLDEILPATIQGEWHGELMNRRKDGNEFPIYLSTTIIKDKEGKVLGLIGVATDITKRKSVEKELIEAKEKAEESDRLKSAFLANMSHEVRTPLNSIIGFSELLIDPFFEEEDKNEFIQHIINNGKNLLTIISDIMDISKMESGKITIRKSRINAQKFISGIKEQFAFQTEGKRLDLKLTLPDTDEETIVFTDVDRLSQIFNNLISNALKFTANGSIEIGYQPKGNMVEFFIKDTGIGIPEEYHDSIFERFRQVEGAKTRKYGGNGLGLAITKNLVELMGGRIWLHSELGKGSVFYFTLPIDS